MTARTCPNWPDLMELDPDLQFKHYTVAEVQLPAEALARMTHVSLAEVEICCDLEHHVVNPGHTPPEVCEALRGTALGTPPEAAASQVRRFRAHDEDTLAAQAAVRDDETKLIDTAQASAKQLESLFEADAR